MKRLGKTLALDFEIPPDGAVKLKGHFIKGKIIMNTGLKGLGRTVSIKCGWKMADVCEGYLLDFFPRLPGEEVVYLKDGIHVAAGNGTLLATEEEGGAAGGGFASKIVGFDPGDERAPPTLRVEWEWSVKTGWVEDEEGGYPEIEEIKHMTPCIPRHQGTQTGIRCDYSEAGL